jgi:hypothetical protein
MYAAALWTLRRGTGLCTSNFHLIEDEGSNICVTTILALLDAIITV